MKKGLIITLCLLLTLLGVAVVTCPDKDAHKDAIMAVVSEKINEELGTTDAEPDLAGLLEGIGSLGAHLGTWYLGSNLTVKNHFIYSVGYLQAAGESHKISVGVFGHVFTFSKEDLDNALEDLI